jgi:hypothetical protein
MSNVLVLMPKALTRIYRVNELVVILAEMHAAIRHMSLRKLDDEGI